MALTPLLYHRNPNCAGGWTAEQCRHLEVYRCLRCDTRHLVTAQTTAAVAAERKMDCFLRQIAVEPAARSVHAA